MDPNDIRVELIDDPTQQINNGKPAEVIWCPHNHLETQVVVTGPVDLRMVKISVSLLGCSRVWIPVALPWEKQCIEWSSFKFLHQTLNVSAPTTITNATYAEHIASCHLTIPQRIPSKNSGVPDQCLSLPPTVSVGDTLKGPGGKKYAQPNIVYSLHAMAKLTSPDGEVKTAHGYKEITIMPCSAPLPPVDINDFPGEFISSVTQAFHASILGPHYSMTLTMPEPPPILMSSMHGLHGSRLHFNVKVQATPGKKADRNLYSICSMLKNLKFSAQLALRAKTFYSTETFTTMPSQAMLGEDGPIRLHDSVVKISEVDVGSSSWRLIFLDDAPRYEEAVQGGLFSPDPSLSRPFLCGSRQSTTVSDESSAFVAWTTSLEVPIELSGHLPPTFCSAYTSRQYSLIMRVRLKGARAKDFVLEVPLQIHYMPSANATSPSDEFESLRGDSTRFVPGQQFYNLLDYDLPDEDLPNYN